VSSATCDDRHGGEEISGIMFIRIGWRYGREWCKIFRTAY
jgi:hypothetical protein